MSRVLEIIELRTKLCVLMGVRGDHGGTTVEIVIMHTDRSLEIPMHFRVYA
jgi:hypothetical protein